MLGRGQNRAAQGGARGDANQQGVTLFKITGDRGFLAADEFYTITFTTLNGSGVTGEAIIGYDVETRTITVAISAAGLEPNQVHTGNDRILDFVSGDDKIDLSDYGITSANVSTAASGADTIISVDADQNGSADFQITLVNAAAPAQGDYFF